MKNIKTLLSSMLLFLVIGVFAFNEASADPRVILSLQNRHAEGSIYYADLYANVPATAWNVGSANFILFYNDDALNLTGLDYSTILNLDPELVSNGYFANETFYSPGMVSFNLVTLAMNPPVFKTGLFRLGTYSWNIDDGTQLDGLAFATDDNNGTIIINGGPFGDQLMYGCGTELCYDVITPEPEFIIPPFSIETGMVEGPFCQGAMFEVDYTAAGTFEIDNMFVAQLSDALGSFDFPTDIGSITSTVSGTITVGIPFDTPAGDGYRIRVVSTNPVVVGTDNGADFSINALPAPVIAGDLSVCSGGTYTYYTVTLPGAVNEWMVEGGTFEVIDDYSISVTWGDAGIGAVAVVQTLNGCDGADAVEVAINGHPEFTITGDADVCAGEIALYYYGNFPSTLEVTGGTLGANGSDENGQYIYVQWGDGPTGSLTVNATNEFGCSTSHTFDVNIHAYPTEGISGTNAICEFGEANYTTPYYEGYSYLWEVEGGNIIGDNTGSTIDVAWGSVGTGTVSLTVSSFGCESFFDIFVDIYSSPTPVITPNGPTSFCFGGSVILTSSEAASYLWSNGETTQSIEVFETGDFNVTITDDFGCVGVSETVSVVVFPLPDMPVITAEGPLAFCYGGSVVLTSSEAYSYLWSNGAATQSIEVFDGGDYWVTIFDENGCSAASEAVTVTVFPLPQAPEITANGPVEFCDGGSVVLTSSEAYSYLWSNGESTQSIEVFDSGEFYVTITDENGCSAVSGIVTVTEFPMPDAPTITAGGPTEFCYGGSVVLTSSEAYSYLWSNGAMTQSIEVFDGSDYSVTITDINGCSAASEAVTVTVFPLPPAPEITADGPIAFCDGGSVVLTSSEAYSYLWSTGATTQSIEVFESGDYYVTITDENGCSAMSGTVTVTVYPLPPAPVITANGPTEFCDGGSVVLTSSEAYSYLWSNGETTQSIEVFESGDFWVTITDINGCSAVSETTTVIVNPNPVPSIEGPNTVYSTTTAQYFAGVGYPYTIGYTFDWGCVGGVITQTFENGIEVLWDGVGEGLVTLTVTVVGTGCSGYTGLSVAINQLPEIYIEGPFSVCAGSTHQYTTTTGQGVTNLWTVTGGTIVGPDDGGSVYVEWGSGPIGSITLTQTGPDYVNEITEDVVINALPAPGINGPASVCEFTTAGYSSEELLGLDYFWSVTGGTIIGDNAGFAIEVAWGGYGEGTVTLHQHNLATGCDGETTFVVDINAVPETPVIGGDDVVVESTTHTYTITNYGELGYGIEWNVTGGTFTGSGNTIDVTWGTPGEGMVSVTVTNFEGGCSASGQLMVEIQTACPPPTVNSRNIIFANVLETSMQVRWARGNGDGVLVVMKEGAPDFVAMPTGDPAQYIVGDYIGNSMEKVVYNGTGTRVVVNDLTPGTQYSYRLYEYRSAECFAWNTTTLSSNPRFKYTMPLTATVNPVVSKTDGSFDVSWQANSNYTHFWVAVTDADGYIINDDWAYVDVGQLTEVTVDGLDPETPYLFWVLPFAYDMAAYNWENGGITKTLATEPDHGPTDVTAIVNQDYSIELGWTPGSYTMILMGIEHNPEGEPVDGYKYNVGDYIGDDQVVYVGDGSSATIYGLDPNILYYFRFYSFNGEDWSEDYQTNTQNYNITNTTTKGVYNILLFAPYNLDVPEKSSSFVGTWEYPENQPWDHFDVEVYDEFGELVFQTTTTDMSVYVSPTVPSTLYTFYVRAGYLDLESMWSDGFSVRTFAEEPAATPTLSVQFAGTDGDGNQMYNFNWASDSDWGLLVLGFDADPTTLPTDGFYYDMTNGDMLGDGQPFTVPANWEGTFTIGGRTEGYTLYARFYPFNGYYWDDSWYFNDQNYNTTNFASASSFAYTPMVPTPFAVDTKTNSSFTAAWEYPVGAYYDIFNLEVWDEFGNIVLNTTTTDMFYDVTGLAPSTLYTFYVRAGYLGYYGDWSEGSSVRTFAPEPTGTPTLEVEFEGRENGYDTFHFSWESTSDWGLLVIGIDEDPSTLPTDGFYYDNTYNMLGDFYPFTVYSSWEGNFTVSGVDPGYRLYARFYGFNGDNWYLNNWILDDQNYNVTDYASANALALTLPAPTMLSVLEKTSDSFVARWDYPVGASVDNFELEVFGNFGSHGVYTTTDMFYNVTGLNPDEYYTYTARALFEDVHSDWADEMLVRTLASEPTAQPTNFLANAGQDYIDISWTKVPGTNTLVVLHWTGYSPFAPADATLYDIGYLDATNGVIVYNGDGEFTHLESTEFLPNTWYYFTFFAYSGNTDDNGDFYEFNSQNYNVVNPLMGSIKTLVAEPLYPPTDMTFTGTSMYQMTVGWTPGIGSENTIILANTTDFFNAPADMVHYAADANFATSAVYPELGGAKVVYYGNSSNVNVTGLNPGLTYYFAAYAVNGPEGEENYYPEGLFGNHMTLTPVAEPAGQDRVIMFQNVTANHIGVRWSAPLSGTGMKRLLLCKKTDQIMTSELPVDGIGYTANGNYRQGSQIGTAGCYVVYNATAIPTSTNPANVDFTLPGDLGATYWFRVCAYNYDPIIPGRENYNITEATFNPRSRQAARPPVLPGDDENNIASSFNITPISPNPVSNNIHFAIESQAEQAFDIEIYSTDGKLVMTAMSNEVINGYKEINIPVSNIAAGTYMIKIGAGYDFVIQTFVLLP